MRYVAFNQHPVVISAIRFVKQYMGMDRTILLATISRLWSLVTGPLTLVLIVMRFTPEVQGYYYTFAGVLALSVFAELGLTTVIQQFASHEWAYLSLDEHGYVVGNSDALSRLTSLMRLAFRWFAVAGILVLIGLGLGGFFFFSKQPAGDVQWVMPWFTLCFLSGINMAFFTPFMGLLDGCNQLLNTYKARLCINIATSLVLWFAILLGAQLWALILVNLTTILITFGFLGFYYRNFFRSLRIPVNGPHINWRQDLWPMQWRIAISWMSGYLIFNLFTPVIFYFRGSVVAGQFGITWMLVNTILQISYSWIATKAPAFGILVAKREYMQLDRIFRSTLLQMLSVDVLGVVVVFAGIGLLNLLEHSFAVRFLPLFPTGFLLLSTIPNAWVWAISVYLRAHRQEPLMLLSVLTSLATVISMILTISFLGLTGMSAGYFVVMLLSSVACVLIFVRLRAEWHRDNPASERVLQNDLST